MLVFEFKAYGKSNQFNAVDEAIRTAKFVRNSCIRYWMDNKKVGKNDLNKYCAVRARLVSAERARSSISRFYDNCKKGYPQFQKDCRWVEDKTTGPPAGRQPQDHNLHRQKGNREVEVKGNTRFAFLLLGPNKTVGHTGTQCTLMQATLS